MNVAIITGAAGLIGSESVAFFADKFDLIIGALPFGMNQIDVEYQGTKLRIPRNWCEILQSLSFLKENGTALYLVEPLGFSNSAGQKFEKELNKK